MGAGRRRWLIASCVVVLCVGAISFLSMEKFGVYFYTPAEAKKEAGAISQREIRVGGMVKQGSVVWDSSTLKLAFTITDLKGTEIAVKHRGAPPDMFKEGSGVVVEGRIDQSGSLLLSRKLMVKHSEEYKRAGDKSLVNHEMLKRSIIKGEDRG